MRFETGAGERRVRWTGGISATGGTSALRLRAHVVCQKHSSAVPLPQGFQKLDQFGIYSLSAGFVRRWIVRTIVDVPLRHSLAPLSRAPAHWIAWTAIPQSPTDSASLISPLLPALARWTVPNVDAAILKDRPAIDCCEAVYFGHLKMTLCQYWIIRKKNRRVDVANAHKGKGNVSMY